MAAAEVQHQLSQSADQLAGDASDDTASDSTDASTEDEEDDAANSSITGEIEPAILHELPQTRASGPSLSKKAESRLANVGKGWNNFKRNFRTDGDGHSSLAKLSIGSTHSEHQAAASRGRDDEGGEEMPAQPEGTRTPINARLQMHINRKLHQDLTDLRLIQETEAHEGVIWAAAFDPAGRHLATGGQDGVVRLWAMLLNRGHNSQTWLTAEQASGLQREGSRQLDGQSCPLLASEPVWEWRDHHKEVLCLAWSREGFLVSGGMDCTAKLWHPSRATCLRTFQHSDWVVAVEMHPLDHRLLTAGVDGKVRVWSIPEQRVLDTADVHEMVTAAAWLPPDGTRVAVATLKGKVRFYGADENGRLEYEAQVDVKNRRPSAKSSKVTGITFQPTSDASCQDGGNFGGHVSSSLLLVTSSDSRLRVFDGYGLVCKLKGPSLGDSLIHARWAPDCHHVICGSENGWAFLWDASAEAASGEGTEKVTAWEAFYVGQCAVTVVLTAPTSAQRPPSALAAARAAKAHEQWIHPAESQAAKASRQLLALRPSAPAHSLATAALEARALVGAIFVATTDTGRIVIAENVGEPRRL